LLTIAIWVLHRALGRVTYAELSGEIAALPGWRIGTALAFTLLSFLALAGYEQSTLRLIGKPQLWRRAWLAAFIAQSIAHSTGYASLVGAGLRYRLYAASRLDLRDVAKIQLLLSMTFALGVMTLGGIALIVEPGVASAVVPSALGWWRALGAWRSVYGTMHVEVRGSRLALPRRGALVVQVLLAVVDLGAAAGALYVLLPDLDVSYAAFVGMFTIAVVIGAASHVPGALGVLESTMLLMLQPLVE
jgi:uncharacterized membrane protein YbhN (UPF0104 family)